MPATTRCSTACRSASMVFVREDPRSRPRSASTTAGTETSAREAQAVFADAFQRNAGVALDDDELAAGIGTVGQLHQALEVVGTPDAGLLGEQVNIGGVAGVPVDVIIEQVALDLGDAGVERILGPRHADRLARLAEHQRRRGVMATV